MKRSSIGRGGGATSCRGVQSIVVRDKPGGVDGTGDLIVGVVGSLVVRGVSSIPTLEIEGYKRGDSVKIIQRQSENSKA